MSYKINFGYEIMRPNKGGFVYEKRNYMVTDNGFYHSFYSAECKGNKWSLPKLDFKPITPFTPKFLNQTYNRKKRSPSPKYCYNYKK